MTVGDTTRLFGRRLGFLAGMTYKNDYSFYERGFIRRYTAGGRAKEPSLDALAAFFPREPRLRNQ